MAEVNPKWKYKPGSIAVKLFVSLSFLVFSNFLESFGSVSKPGTCLKIGNKPFNTLCGMLN